MREKQPVLLDYIEFTSPDMEATQDFFGTVFGWEFTSYGDDYRDISNAGLGGGIERGVLKPPLPVLKTNDLEAMLERVKQAEATITKEIFHFPGGRRFQFLEPGGCEMAIWSEN